MSVFSLYLLDYALDNKYYRNKAKTKHGFSASTHNVQIRYNRVSRRHSLFLHKKHVLRNVIGFAAFVRLFEWFIVFLTT